VLHRPVAPPFTVLFVCTGNICRSPIAERVGRAYLEQVLGDAAPVHLESAGTRAVVGSGVHPDSAGVLTRLGGDPEGFTARQLTDDLALHADLALTLTRDHRRSVLKRAPRRLARTFTLLEAVDLLSFVPDCVDLPGETFAERSRALVKQMAAARAGRPTDARDDIVDPIGQSLAVHGEVGELISDAVRRLLGRFVQLCATHEDRSRTGAPHSLVH
jgi:protein-tyrosine-phosphatase